MSPSSRRLIVLIAASASALALLVRCHLADVVIRIECTGPPSARICSVQDRPEDLDFRGLVSLSLSRTKFEENLDAFTLVVQNEGREYPCRIQTGSGKLGSTLLLGAVAEGAGGYLLHTDGVLELVAPRGREHTVALRFNGKKSIFFDGSAMHTDGVVAAKPEARAATFSGPGFFGVTIGASSSYQLREQPGSPGQDPELSWEVAQRRPGRPATLSTWQFSVSLPGRMEIGGCFVLVEDGNWSASVVGVHGHEAVWTCHVALD